MRTHTFFVSVMLGCGVLGCERFLDYEVDGQDSGADSNMLDMTDGDVGCDVSSDPNSCGVCGHSCLGGACSAGVCQPVVLASGQGNALGASVSGLDAGVLDGPGRIATDGTFAYWLNLGGEVMRVPVAGGTPSRVATTAAEPVWIELDMTFVYFMSAATGTVFRVPKSGGTPVELTPPPPAGGIGNEFLIYAAELYWADTVADYMCPVSGCGGAAKNLWAGPSATTESPYSMTVVSAPLIFVSEVDPSGFADIAMPTAGNSCVNVISGDRYVELHADATQIYALSSQGVLAASGTQCGPATYLASGMSGAPHGLALDDGYVYWVNVGDGIVNETADVPNKIARCAKTGCAAPEVLAIEPSTANAIAVDATAVYWTTGDGKVKRLAKPAAASSGVP